MESEANGITTNEKVVKVLQKFLEPNFKVNNDVYLNLFLTNLIETKKKLNKEQKALFGQWLIRATRLWMKDQTTPSAPIVSFALNLASLLSAEEEEFSNLNNAKNLYESLIEVAKKNFDNDANIVLGYITLLCSFLEHDTGVRWLIDTTYWSEIVPLGRNAHTMYIRKKSYQFVAKFLEKSITINKSVCTNLVESLVAPLNETLNKLPRLDSGEPAAIENKTLFDTVKPSLIFISEVMEYLVKDLHYEALKLFNELKAIDLCKKLLLLSQLEDFSFELLKILCIPLFSTINQAETTSPNRTRSAVVYFDMNALFDILEGEMHKDHVKCIIKSCHYLHVLYCELRGKIMMRYKRGESIDFQYQMVLFQLVPFLEFCLQFNVCQNSIVNDVFRMEYIQKLLKLSAVRTVDILFRWKVRLTHKPLRLDDIVFGLQYMLKVKKYLSKEQAVVFLRPLIFALQDCLMYLETTKGSYDAAFSGRKEFVRALCETIIDLVQSFSLTWKDSVEITSVLKITCDFFEYDHWDQKMVVSLLRLLDLAMARYMSPEMILLMDSSNSVVCRVGKLLSKHCHDRSWEIRDSALDCVCTLSANANSNFPSHANILIEAELPQLIVQMALYDGEPFVRGAAFKCLQELVQIQLIWEIYTAENTFLDKILKVFEVETEGIVRKEAATLVYKIEKFQSFPHEISNRVHDVMTHAVVGDLHWEVKCNALEFWFNIFKAQLHHQGMIDNAFPSVTFSKEHRKIVTLDVKEVRKRLIIVLNKLSHIGCLFVLKHACLDDYDVEVARKASKEMSEMVQTLQKYQVLPGDTDLDIDTNQVNSQGRGGLEKPSNAESSLNSVNNCDVLGQSVQLSKDLESYEAIIEDVLNSTDTSCLQQIYNPSDEVQTMVISELRKSEYLSPSEFVDFIYRHTENNTTNERLKWLNGLDEFDSLLEDILREYNVRPGVNSMDCY